MTVLRFREFNRNLFFRQGAMVLRAEWQWTIRRRYEDQAGVLETERISITH